MQLYNHFRSSASYRVRIALELKRLDGTYLPVDLPHNEHLAPLFASLVPQQLVPVLKDGPAVLLTQSMPIIEYLEKTHPEPPLLPAASIQRARVRALALDVARDIHPLASLWVLRYLMRDLHVSAEDKNRWCRRLCLPAFADTQPAACPDAN